MALFNLNESQQVTIPLPIPIELGGTGSSEMRFVDLDTEQTIDKPKNFKYLKIGAHLPFKFNDSHDFGASFDNLDNGVFSGDSASVDGVLKGWHVLSSSNTRGGGFGVQLALSDTDGYGISFRQKTTGFWWPWKRIFHEGIFNPASHSQTFTPDKLATCRSSGNLSNPAGGDGRGLEVRSDSPNSAYIAFHIGLQFACYFGIDASDNSLRIGGWSYGNVSYRIWNETYGVPVWQAPSDKRLKNSIKPIPTDSALDLVSQFNPIKFRYTAKVRRTEIFGDLKLRCQSHYGFLAQELPSNDLLLIKPDGELGVNYIEIIPLLVASIQELQKQIVELRQQIRSQ